jgi:hypothetical protein
MRAVKTHKRSTEDPENLKGPKNRSKRAQKGSIGHQDLVWRRPPPFGACFLALFFKHIAVA